MTSREEEPLPQWLFFLILVGSIALGCVIARYG